MWNYVSHEMVELNRDLTFESDMRVTVINKKQRSLFGASNWIIGEFVVPLQSILAESEVPQFFNLINAEGQFMG